MKKIEAKISSRKRKSASESSTKQSASNFGTCENVSSRYEKVGRVGEGTYGVVYKAKDRETHKYVALKRCIPHHESSDGIPLTTLREIHALRLCSRHEHVVDLISVSVSQSGGVFLVCEFCSHDIAQLMDENYSKYRQSPFDQSQVKTLMAQLLSALAYCHSHSLIHRDIKPSKFLLSG